MSGRAGQIDWAERFQDLYEKGASAFDAGDRDWRGWFSEKEAGWLQSIGATPHEVFDFVEDRGELAFGSALLITAVRRDYFSEAQGGVVSTHRVTEAEVPGRKAELEGMVWLPRLLAKARARLRGELDDALMFCCGGDRGFFRRHGIHPADFLRAVWAAGDNDGRVAEFVRSGGGAPG